MTNVKVQTIGCQNKLKTRSKEGLNNVPTTESGQNNVKIIPTEVPTAEGMSKERQKNVQRMPKEGPDNGR